MLKKYLQALLEAFIGSKKEWISDLSAPSTTYIDVSGLKTDGSVLYYTPTQNGFIYLRVIDSHTEAVELRCPRTNSGTLMGGKPYNGISLRVRKGEPIMVMARPDSGQKIEEHSLVFVPDQAYI